MMGKVSSSFGVELPSTQEVIKLRGSLDTNKDGKLSEEEFIVLIEELFKILLKHA